MSWINDATVTTAEEIERERVRTEIAEIDAQLREIDLKSLRAIRATLSSDDNSFDLDELKKLENRANELRNERRNKTDLG